MDGGDSEKEEDWAAGLPPSLAGVKLIDAPVLFLVVSHKAFRAELASVRRVAAEAAESGGYSREVVVDLGRRLDFLKLAYSYHTAAEDEVIFLALDAHVKNVVATYSLEHKSIDDKFSSIFLHLDLLMNSDEDSPQIFQDLLFSIGTVQTMICQHMQKEEQQVFPLLTKKFTSEQQSQLVWQYMCSVPIILLEDFLPWMSFYLSLNERIEVLHCIRLIMPNERLLLEVVVSLLEHSESSSSEAYDIYGKGYQILNVLSGSMDIIKLYPPQIKCETDQQLKEEGPVQTNWVEGPIKGIYHWHAALRRDLGQIIEELYEIRSSNSLASLSSVIVHLKFIADVLIYYSKSLDKFFYPLLSQIAKNSLSSWRQLIDENQIKCLQRFLFCKLRGSAQLRSSMEMLYKELETLVSGFSRNLIFLETEVFPFISSNYTREMQLWLLYTCLHVMPLGLLRCTVPWFSAQLSENHSCSILDIIKMGCPAVNKSFTSLLYEWVRIGCSGKTSTAKFRQDLEEMFSGRSFYFSEHSRPMTIFSDELESNSALEMPQISAMSSCSVPVTTEEPSLYTNGMNLHVFFSQMFKRIPHLDNNQEEPRDASFPTLESRPMDHILYIHRALSKDLEYLVSLSAKLTANIGLLGEFKKRFKLFRNIYQIHSISEDEIAFPALESKRALQNVSHSYSIEHKLEVKQFEKASEILTEICELHDVGSKETRVKHYQLCLKLHDTCLSMRKVLSDHICREEVEIFSLFRGYFSIEEEEKIVGNMLGIIRAEILQEMIPWLMAYLTSDEQLAITSLWLKVARYTKFGDWLREWWEDMTRYNLSKVEEGSKPSPALAADPLEIVSLYLQKDGIQTKKDDHDRGAKGEFDFDRFKHSGFYNLDREALSRGGQDGCQSQKVSLYPSEVEKKRSIETKDKSHNDEVELEGKECQKSNHQEHPLHMNQEELEATIRRVSRDSTLDSQKKSYIIQNLLMSQWLITQKMSSEAAAANDKGEIPGQLPSYRDPLTLTFGCQHYKRNSKILAPCCNKLYTCIRCHDDLTDHVLDRKSVTKMMCMKCLLIQPIGPKCVNSACRDLSMGKYYCHICKLFDDERKIYHCPYCNLCRVGKGLGIDYFHCMKCNACMSRSLFVHVCREKCLEDNCPICHEYIFTSNIPVKALPCGHLMHSACFQDYTCSHYICPICSKSLGDMQVYFGMLDALLAEEKIPEEYSAQIQVILCNDCEKRGTASFHWLYHKCPHCGSYNTRVV